MQAIEKITPKTVLSKATYQIDIRQRAAMGSMPQENVVKIIAEKKLLSRDEEGFVYRLHIPERKQSNQEGIRALEYDLSWLQQKLELRTNNQGEVTHIFNLWEIEDIWRANRNRFYQKHKRFSAIEDVMEQTDVLLQNPERFISVFKESEVGSLLFPPLYEEHTEIGQKTAQHKVFEGFFETVDLPLLLTTTLKRRKELIANNAHLLRKGTLDTDRFDQKRVQKMFRKLADKITLKVGVDLNYLETYDLDRYDWIDYAGQLFRVRIKGLFTFEQIARITPLKKEL
ncbi:hypothetical protein ED312_15430 [Sinomicrobium pectinilyticum]|uniref:Uncharacterized protein n=1 Tax=Sinomicrobium pectinilyticum TaxID=1084421 RepID=A0A3N0E649_SINP1|nr:hypothetical protein [Sinomicrobium pectinilyticum]RNL83273.1 hypothetical protein ED312_15430 [Sinomicrobium pectinilyticum]